VGWWANWCCALPPLELFGPDSLRIEVSRHREKIARAARLSLDEIAFLEERVLTPVRIIPHDLVLAHHWERAYDLVKDIDVDDDPFVALALHLRCPLWTGDKKLVRGLRRKGFKHVITSEELRKKLGV
jgi:predicted nucleic acid-binding protein